MSDQVDTCERCGWPVTIYSARRTGKPDPFVVVRFGCGRCGHWTIRDPRQAKKATLNIRKLTVALANYECASAPQEIFDEAGIEEALASRHCGDCVGMPATCPRCFAEEMRKKAEWIVKQL